MTSTPDKKRRVVLAGIADALLGSPSMAASLLGATPRQPAGPFYPVELPLDDDNDLTQVKGRDGIAKGQMSDLHGQILDTNGRPITGVRVEIWQCDANGRYRHPGDRGGKALDANFQGHGRATTDNEGRYRFRTIRPVPYPGRTPHIHMAVFAPGERPFVTQLYIKGEPRNDTDFLFRRIPTERRHLIVADFAPGRSGEAELDARFNVILASTGGTPSA